jgi:predicted AAA+ superfamily ATPase
LAYWREGDREVDFVVASGGDVWAIEVKSGRSAKTSGLAGFKSRYPESKVLMVGSHGIPLDDFFKSDPSKWLI